MKINKILAAGVAATLAVTSLSAVASAEVKQLEWKMDYTYSKVQWNSLKMEWLDDNDYITSGLGSYTVAAQNLNGALDASDDNKLGTVLDLITLGVKVGDANKALDGTETLDTLTGKDEGYWDKDLAAEFQAALEAAGKEETGYIAKAIENSGAEKGQTVDEKQEKYNKEAVGGVNSAISAWKTAIAKAEAARDKALKDADDADTKKAIKEAISGVTSKIQDIIKAAAEAVDDWKADVEGPKLISETEVGGLFLSKKAFKVTLDNTTYYVKPTGAKLTIKGTKRGSTATETFSTDFKQAYKEYGADLKGVSGKEDDYFFVAFAPKYVNREGFVNLNVYGAITDASIDVSYTLYDDADCKIETWKYTEKEYDAVKEIAMQTLRDGTNFDYIDTNVDSVEAVDKWTPKTTIDGTTSALTDTVAALTDHSTALFKLFYGLDNSKVYGTTKDNSNSKTTLQPFLRMTTDTEGETIVRNRVRVLSFTGDHASLTSNGKNDEYLDGRTQTYDDAGMGTQPKWFAGLASQCADFFTKQNNGQIIFKFKDPALADKWVSYGVPSTEVGLRTLQGTAMALFFNYATTTGSIQTIGVVDKDAWTITFDLATVLEDFNYSTKANLHDIYYGLNTGVDYGAPYSAKGYVVEKVTLQYDDAPAAVDATTDDDAAVVVADDDDDVVADDDDDDVFADDDVVADDDDDDDDDAGIIEDDDDDDTDVNNDVDYVDGADDDANPGTGVGLAVIPAIVAAAAAVVSKKRK